jgi:hypothetical protein
MAKLELLDVGESALLVRFGSELGTQHFIFGKDGNMGQPFVTQVGKKVVTLIDAFDGLMPKIVKDAIAQGLNVKRQGDWFFIPVKEPVCKKSFKRSVYRNLEGRRINTGLRPNVLYYDWRFRETRHTVRGEILFRAVGRHYVRGTVDAPDHEPLSLGMKRWHLAVRRNSLNWENTRGRQRDD